MSQAEDDKSNFTISGAASVVGNQLWNFHVRLANDDFVQ